MLNVVRFAQFRSVFGGVGWGGSRLHMSLKVHRISSMNSSRKCICPQQIVYAYFASGGFGPRPPSGLCPLTTLGDFHPQTPFAHPTSKPWLLRQPDSVRFTVFYRAMHYSAKRGLPITCRLSVRPSVRPSVTLVDHDYIGGKSWKLTARKLAQHLRSS